MTKDELIAQLQALDAPGTAIVYLADSVASIGLACSVYTSEYRNARGERVGEKMIGISIK